MPLIAMRNPLRIGPGATARSCRCCGLQCSVETAPGYRSVCRLAIRNPLRIVSHRMPRSFPSCSPAAPRRKMSRRQISCRSASGVAIAATITYAQRPPCQRLRSNAFVVSDRVLHVSAQSAFCSYGSRGRRAFRVPAQPPSSPATARPPSATASQRAGAALRKVAMSAPVRGERYPFDLQPRARSARHRSKPAGPRRTTRRASASTPQRAGGAK
jgi:hypothetical protein